MLTPQRTPLKTCRATLASAIFRIFGSCFGSFDIVLDTQYTYIIAKYKIYLHAAKQARNSDKGLAFLPVSKARANKKK